MGYLKNHYEKAILFVVLLIVAISAFMLTSEVGAIRTKLDDQLRIAIGGKQKALRAADLTNATVALARLTGSYNVALAGEHRTFNPMAWAKSGDAFKRLPDKSVGITVSKISPLHLIINFTAVLGVPENLRYQFSISKEFEKQPNKRKPVTTSLNEGIKNEVFVLREVKGPKDAPTSVVITLLGGGEPIEIVKDKAFSKVLGYAADIKIDNSSREYLNRRQDDIISVSSVNYKVISISSQEVIVEAPNKARVSLRPIATP